MIWLCCNQNQSSQGRLDHLKPGVNLGALAGTLLGSPLVPYKPHFPKFPHLGFMCLIHEPENTYFWHENELILVSFHELYQSSNGSFSFLAACAEEERNNCWQKPFQLSQLSVTLFLALCHLRIDGTSVCRERILPLLDTCPCSDQIQTSGGLMGGSSSYSLFAEIQLSSSRVPQSTGFVCVWASQTHLGFIDMLAWA